MTIALAKDVEDFLEEQVRAGVCPDASELVNDVLRSVREQRHQPFETSPELEAWLLASADQPTTPLTSADFDDIRIFYEAADDVVILRRSMHGHRDLPRRLLEPPRTGCS